MHKLSEQLKTLLEKDIRKVVEAGEIKPTDYPCLANAVDIYKDLETIIAMEQANNMEQQNSYNSYGSYGSYGNGGGMSNQQSYMVPNSRDGWSMNQSYDGYSGARGRSPRTGRYVSRDSDPMMRLSEMMANAKSPEEQEIIRRMMDEYGA